MGGGLQRVQLAAMEEDIQDLFAWLGAPLTEITSCEGEKLMKLLLRAEREMKWGGNAREQPDGFACKWIRQRGWCNGELPGLLARPPRWIISAQRFAVSLSLSLFWSESPARCSDGRSEEAAVRLPAPLRRADWM